MHELLEAQAYRLAYWRVAADEINYRRFFDINNLAALRMDDPEVFESTHQLVRDLLARGWVNGLRIDHPDGLLRPQGVFRAPAGHGGGGGGLGGGRPRPLYLVARRSSAPMSICPPPGRSTAPPATISPRRAAACSSIRPREERFSHLYNAFARSACGTWRTGSGKTST